MSDVPSLNHLSTTTLIAALLHEPNWESQIELARMIESRRDCYNVLPLCEFLLETQQNRSVQREVARCVARHGLAQALRWMESCILNPKIALERRLLAMHALSDFRRPAETSPLFARLCTPELPAEIRSEALIRLGRTRSPWALIALAGLLEHGHSGIAGKVKRQIAIWIDQAGGLSAAVSQLSDCAVESVRRGNATVAGQAMHAAIQLAESAPQAQELIYRELRSRLAA